MKLSPELEKKIIDEVQKRLKEALEPDFDIQDWKYSINVCISLELFADLSEA